MLQFGLNITVSLALAQAPLYNNHIENKRGNSMSNNHLLITKNKDTGQTLTILGLFSCRDIAKDIACDKNEQVIKACRFVPDGNPIAVLKWSEGETPGTLTSPAYQGNGIIFQIADMELDQQTNF